MGKRQRAKEVGTEFFRSDFKSVGTSGIQEKSCPTAPPNTTAEPFNVESYNPSRLRAGGYQGQANSYDREFATQAES